MQDRNSQQTFSKEEQNRQLNRLKASYLPNYKANYYQDKSDIGISSDEHERIMQQKYADAYNNVTKNYPLFNTYSPSQQDALLDMNYNLGTPKFNKYTLMKEAIHSGNWQEAAKQSYRSGVSKFRNDWTAKSFDPDRDKDNGRF